MKKLSLIFCLISTALFSQPVLTGRQGGTGVANTNKTITLGSSLSWPTNGVGILNNDGSGNLSWGSAGASTFTINGTSMTTGNAYTVTAAAGTLTGSSLAAGVTSSSLTSFGASPTFTTPTIGTATATSIYIGGAGGSGFLSLTTQTAQPSSPSSGTILFSNSNSKLSWRGSGNTYMKTLDAGNNSADRVYSLPNRDVKIDSLTTSTSTALNGVIQGNGSVLSSVSTVGSGSVGLQGALTSYTPTWTSAGTPPSAGNATVTAQYIKTGRVVNVWILYQTGSTTTFGSANAWTFSLPSTASSVNNILGEAYGFNYLVSNYTGVCYGASTTTFSIVSHLNGSSWLSTAPGTWGGAGNSFFKFHVTYTE